jgi:hypothetical protein
MPKDKRIEAYIAKLLPWQKAILAKLRALVHQADPQIEESLKWSQPAYSHEGLVCITAAHKEWVNFVLFKGALIPDKFKLYHHEGTRAQLGVIKISDVKQVKDKPYLHYLKAAVALNLSGAKAPRKEPPKGPVDLPRAFEQLLEEHDVLKAFKARAPYQQRGYMNWTSAPKQEATRERRRETMIKELREGTFMPSKGTRPERKKGWPA